MSSPPSCEMKPKPFSSLNHLTVPRKSVPSFRCHGLFPVVPEVKRCAADLALQEPSNPRRARIPEARPCESARNALASCLERRGDGPVAQDQQRLATRQQPSVAFEPKPTAFLA